jgi:hypothetical protein
MGTLPAEIGHRIYEVRRDLGPDARHEMPQRAFAALLNEKAAELYPDKDTRSNYDSSVVTRMEKGLRRITVQDVVIVAAVDKKRRGVLWLICEGVDATMLDPEVARLGAMPNLSAAEAAALIAENEERPPARVAGTIGGKSNP